MRRWQSSVLEWPSLLHVALAILCSRIVYVFAAFFTLSRLAEVRQSGSVGGDVKSISTSMRESSSFASDAALATLFSQIDMLILGFVLSKHDLGIYSAGSRLVVLILTVPFMLQSVVIPRLSKAVGSVAFIRLFDRFGIGMLVLAISSGAFLNLFGSSVVRLLLGPSFEEVDVLWFSFSILIFARVLESFIGINLYSIGAVRTRALSVCVGIALSLSIGAVTAKYGGSESFIAAFSLSYLAVAMVGVWKLRDEPSIGGVRIAFLVAYCLILLCSAIWWALWSTNN